MIVTFLADPGLFRTGADSVETHCIFDRKLANARSWSGHYSSPTGLPLGVLQRRNPGPEGLERLKLVGVWRRSVEAEHLTWRPATSSYCSRSLPEMLIPASTFMTIQPRSIVSASSSTRRLLRPRCLALCKYPLGLERSDVTVSPRQVQYTQERVRHSLL